jgi:cell division transport system ATP-binding protein
MNLLFQIAKELGTAVVMATHDYLVINKFPARTIKTEGGKVIDNVSLNV